MKATLYSACALGFGLGLVNGKPVPELSQAGQDTTTCLDDAGVSYDIESSADYSELAEPYNLRLPYKPAVIVLPETDKHVEDAVVCAGKNGLKVQAKSGGHSYASYS